MTVAQWIVNLAMMYAAVGLVLAIIFVLFGLGRIDESAKGAPVFFRLLILPGAAALWPVLLRRWLRGQTQPPIEKNPHRRVQEVRQ
ncbi:MAG: hypothetical protein ABI977_05635 [Acidobacteriota bacterium]